MYRRRKIEEEGREVRSVQIVYERSSEIERRDVDQFRYFPKEKDKFYFLLDETSEMPESIADITNLKVRERLGKVQAEGQKDVYFKRAIVHALNGLLVAVDEVRQNQPFYVVELKVHDDKHLLKEAMRALMLNFPMVQTTLGKYDLMRS